MKVLIGCVLLVLASLTNGTAADNLIVSISSPRDGAGVDYRQEVSGKVSDPNADVWLVIHPVETSDFWVQPPVTVKENGSWKVVVYFGEAGRHVGKKFEVRAFANPVVAISEGKSAQWPKAATRSKVIEVIRR